MITFLSRRSWTPMIVATALAGLARWATTPEPAPAPTTLTAALAHAAHDPDADTCDAVAAWLDRSHDAADLVPVAEALDAAQAPCLVPAIRRALDVPALIVPASAALARLATPDERAEAILALLDRRPAPGWQRAIETLARGLHPDHCGARAQCLTRAAAERFENALELRVAPNPPPEESRAYGVRRFFDGSAGAIRVLNERDPDSWTVF